MRCGARLKVPADSAESLRRVLSPGEQVEQVFDIGFAAQFGRTPRGKCRRVLCSRRRRARTRGANGDGTGSCRIAVRCRSTRRRISDGRSGCLPADRGQREGYVGYWRHRQIGLTCSAHHSTLAGRNGCRDGLRRNHCRSRLVVKEIDHLQCVERRTDTVRVHIDKIMNASRGRAKRSAPLRIQAIDDVQSVERADHTVAVHVERIDGIDPRRNVWVLNRPGDLRRVNVLAGRIGQVQKQRFAGPSIWCRPSNWDGDGRRSWCPACEPPDAY